MTPFQKTYLCRVWPRLLALWGEEIDYTAEGMEPVAVEAVLKTGAADREHFGYTQGVKYDGVLKVSTEDIETVSITDSFIAAGVDWRVKAVLESGAVHVLAVVRYETERTGVQKSRRYS